MRSGVTDSGEAPQPRLGIQGPVVGWQDPWAGPASDRIMRTGTGVLLDSQDGFAPPEAFLGLLGDLGAEFYVHHVMPDLAGHDAMLEDLARAGLDVVLGNEYGNINGPHQSGTNRYDVPTAAIRSAVDSGCLAGLLYDEPEHLQVNASQYRRDAWAPHFAPTAGLTPSSAEERVASAVRNVVDSLGAAVPVLAEHVFPVMFHTLARGGMTPCPKVMKEAFQPLQLATALGAAKQYRRDLWICADLWGPDVGPWFTRAPGFPGHSPAEYASALRMAYLFGPSHLFTENVDALARYTSTGFATTEFGEVWQEFVRDFVPRHPLTWSARDARPRTVIIHAEDSNFGHGTRPFGDPDGRAPAESWSVFDAWHLLSRGTIPRAGSCMHAPGFEAPPRCRLDSVDRSRFPLSSGVEEGDPGTHEHGLFHALHDVLVYDETVGPETLGQPDLIVVAGSRLPEHTRALLRSKAEAGATVVLPEWLAGRWTRTERVGAGTWTVVSDLIDDEDARSVVEPHLGPDDVWTQRFGTVDVRFSPADGAKTTLEFEIVPR